MQRNPGNQEHLFNSNDCHIEFKSSMAFKEFEECSGKWIFTDTYGEDRNKFTNVIVSCGKKVVLKICALIYYLQT